MHVALNLPDDAVLEVVMKVTVPELALIAGTRGMLGAGIGLLAAGRLSDDQRRIVGRVLLAIGAITTSPLAFQVFHRPHPATAPTSPVL
jgi:hypothetical protein